MAYHPELPGCFGEQDLFFAVHPLDQERGFAWLTKLRKEEVVWADTAEQIVGYLRDKGAADTYIDEQLNRAKAMLAPWLYGPVNEE